MLIASSRSDLDRLHRAGARAATVLGLDDRDVLLDAVPSGPSLASAGVTHLAQGASITALHARGHGDDLATVAVAARLLPVTVLVVPVDDAIRLGRTLAGARIELRHLRRVVTLGPPPETDLRGEIAATFAAIAKMMTSVALKPKTDDAMMAPNVKTPESPSRKTADATRKSSVATP